MQATFYLYLTKYNNNNNNNRYAKTWILCIVRLTARMVGVTFLAKLLVAAVARFLDAPRAIKSTCAGCVKMQVMSIPMIRIIERLTARRGFKQSCITEPSDLQKVEFEPMDFM